MSSVRFQDIFECEAWNHLRLSSGLCLSQDFEVLVGHFVPCTGWALSRPCRAARQRRMTQRYVLVYQDQYGLPHHLECNTTCL